MDKPAYIRMPEIYLLKVTKFQDNLVTITTAHLLTEYLINQIIKNKCHESKKILDDHRAYTYAVKLTIIYCANLIPDYAFDNLVRLNKLRNEFAHNLQPSNDKLIPILKYASIPQSGSDSPKEILFNIGDKSGEIPNFIGEMCLVILNDLLMHCHNKLKIDIEFNL